MDGRTYGRTDGRTGGRTFLPSILLGRLSEVDLNITCTEMGMLLIFLLDAEIF